MNRLESRNPSPANLLAGGHAACHAPLTSVAETETFSQSGEDRLIWDFFGRKAAGTFAEVGANDPEIGSQTWLLERNGWEGVLVEPQPQCCERLRSRRLRSKVFQAACGAPEQRGQALFHVASADTLSSLKKSTRDRGVTWQATLEVPVRTLDEILDEAGYTRLDFLSIDVEGTELGVLRGIDLRRRQPKLIVVEDYVYTLATHRHLTARGYRLVKRTGSNNWYIPMNRRFELSTRGERVALFRKMYLGTPLRQLKLRLRGQWPP